MLNCQCHRLTQSLSLSMLLLWPKQACPFEKSWTLWRGALKLAYLSPKVLRASTARTMLPLNVPLRPWIGERHRSRRSWNSYVSTNSKILYQNRIVGYQLHHSIESTFRQRRFQIDCFSALPDLSTTTSIIPVWVMPATRCLESSKLTRPATIPDDDIQIEPDTVNQTLYRCMAIGDALVRVPDA